MKPLAFLSSKMYNFYLLTLTSQGERLRPEELYTALYNDDMLTCAKSLYDFDTRCSGNMSNILIIFILFRSCDLTTKEIRNVAIDYVSLLFSIVCFDFY